MKSIKLYLTSLFTYLLILGIVNGQSNSILPNSISIEHENGNETVRLNAQEGGEGSQLMLFNAAGKRTTLLDGEWSANASSLFQLFDNNGTATVNLYSDRTDALSGRILLKNEADRDAVVIDATQGVGNGAGMSLYNHAGSHTIILDAENGAQGNSVIRMDDRSGIASLLLYSDVTEARGSRILMNNDEARRTIVIDAQQGSGNGSGIELFNYAGQRTVLIDAENGANGPALISVAGKLIIEGSDFSENFSITSKATTPIEAGTLLCIDPNNEAKLKVSHQAYDQLIAGIVSGAGGVRTGMVMGQSGTLADGDTPVAISGRVYVKAEATQRAIQPGDLLTSSTIAGHAMKIKNYRKAKGAIIGKALTSLSKGEKGLVLVLVNLQ